MGLGGEDSAYIKFTLGLAILTLGGVFAFRYFSARYCFYNIKEVFFAFSSVRTTYFFHKFFYFSDEKQGRRKADVVSRYL